MASIPDPTLPAWYYENLADWFDQETEGDGYSRHNEGSNDPEPFIRGRKDEPVQAQLIIPPPNRLAPNGQVKYGAVVRVKPRPKPCWEGLVIYMSVDPVPEEEDEGYGEGEMPIDEEDDDDEETVDEPYGWLEPDIGEAEGGLEIESDPDALYFIFKDVKFPEVAGRYRVRFDIWVDSYRDDQNGFRPLAELWPKGTDLKRFQDDFYEGYLVGFLAVKSCTEVIENWENPYQMDARHLEFIKFLEEKGKKFDPYREKETKALAGSSFQGFKRKLSTSSSESRESKRERRKRARSERARSERARRELSASSSESGGSKQPKKKKRSSGSPSGSLGSKRPRMTT